MNIPSTLLAKAKKIKLLLLDVDGVLTDGRMVLSGQNDELKFFDVHDGLGIALLQSTGIPVGIITKRDSAVVARRAAELSIQHVYQGQKDKLTPYRELLKKLSLQEEEVAYMGDDLPDLPLLLRVGLSSTPQDGLPEIQQRVDFVSAHKGGRGAVRELSELLMKAQNTYEAALAPFLESK